MKDTILFKKSIRSLKSHLISLILVEIIIFLPFISTITDTHNIVGENNQINEKVDEKIPCISESPFWDDYGAHICNESGSQFSPQIISDGSGGTIIVWRDNRDTSAIYAQRVNFMGIGQWSPNGVCIAPPPHYIPNINNIQVESDGMGGAIIAWEQTGWDKDLYAQKINSTGDLQWSPNGVAICTAIEDQIDPQIISDGAGGAIIAWRDHRNYYVDWLGDAYGGWELYVQRVNASGTVQWNSNGVCIADSPDVYRSIHCMNLQMTTDGLNGAIIAWEKYDSNENTYRVYIQKINSSGTTLWTPNGILICSGIWQQYKPDLESDGLGGAIVAWTDCRSDFDIYAQKFNSAGNRLWADYGVAICTANDNQNNQMILSDGNNGVIIVWADIRNEIDANIYAQKVNSTGDVEWTLNGVVICAQEDFQNNPNIVSDGFNGAIITWEDDRNAGYINFYAQKVNSMGIVQWTPTGVAICNSSFSQYAAQSVIDEFDELVVTWYDYRSGDSSNIYAQRLDSAGNLQWISPDRPEVNHPNDITIKINENGGIGWVITDSVGFGYYHIIVTDTSGFSYTLVDWSPWMNNTDLNVTINSNINGLFDYTIEYYNNDTYHGFPDTVIVEVYESGGIVTPIETWNFTSGEPGNDSMAVITKLGDDYYIASMYEASFGNLDVLITKTNSTGQIQWTQTWGGPGNEYVYDIDKYEWEFGYGIFFITGSYFNVSRGDTDIFAVCYDQQGNKYWESIWGGPGNDTGYCILMDTYYTAYCILIGGIENGTEKDIYITLINAWSGWSASFQNFTTGWSGDDFVDSAIFNLNEQNAIYIAGKTTNELHTDGFVMKLNYNRSEEKIDAQIWNRTWTNSYTTCVSDLVYTENSLSITGNEQFTPQSKSNIYIIKLDLEGNQIWKRWLGDSSGNYYASQITRYEDGNFYILGTTDDMTHGGSDVILMKCSENGFLRWNYTWGSINDEDGIDFLIHKGMCYIIGNTATEEDDLDRFMVALLIFDLPLKIDSNQSLSLKADRGNGTIIDPYIIQNLIIDMSMDGTGISIQNTNMYLIIQDCCIFNVGNNASIFINYCKNIVIQKCYIKSNQLGFGFSNTNSCSIINCSSSTIHLSLSDMNTITNSTFNNLIVESYSDGNLFQNNSISGYITISQNCNNSIVDRNNIAGDISISQYCSNNLINKNKIAGDFSISQYSINNFIQQNNFYGSFQMTLYSNNNTLQRNYFDNGLTISQGTKKCIITENIVNGSVYIAGHTGIYWCSSILIHNNTIISKNSLAGIKIEYSFSSNITDNLISNSKTEVGDGIIFSLGESLDIIIAGNVIEKFNNGITLSQNPLNIQIINNTVQQNNIGLFLDKSRNTVIDRNWILNNSFDGIFVSSLATNISISINHISNNLYYGIRIYEGSRKTQVISNWIINNGIAPYFDMYGTTYFWNNTYVDYVHLDTDRDGLTDQYEMEIGTSIDLVDTDGDNYLDGYEVKVGSDPSDEFSIPSLPEAQYNEIVEKLQGNMTLINLILGFVDGNWTYLQSMRETINANITTITSILEQLDGTLGDLDSDGLADLYEIGNGTDPTCIDTDCDNLNDAFELKIGTNPTDDDTDGDGALDGIEIMAGYDPLDASNFPGMTTTSYPPLSIPAIIGIGSGGVLIILSVIGVIIRKYRK